VQVVDENSATIPGNPYNIGLEADHRGINKFESNADPNYIKVLDKLKRLVDSTPDVLKRGTAPSLPVLSRPVAWADGGVRQLEAARDKGCRIIPYSQNDRFTGRESVCVQLTGLLSKSGHQRAALYGLGGVGYVLVFIGSLIL
jgi:hypothetical protein